MKRLAVRSGILLGLVSFLLLASASAAQFGRGRQAPRLVPPGSYTGSFLFCQFSFRDQVGGAGGGWNVDYPRSDVNLSFRLAELTKTPISLKGGSCGRTTSGESAPGRSGPESWRRRASRARRPG